MRNWLRAPNKQLVRAVIDTNVLLSGAAASKTPPAKVMDALLQGGITAVFTAQTFLELQTVLYRPAIGTWLMRAKCDPFALLKQIESVAVFVPPGKLPKTSLRDSQDLPLLAAALSTPRVEALITGDKDLLAIASEVSPLQILTPAEFMRILQV